MRIQTLSQAEKDLLDVLEDFVKCDSQVFYILLKGVSMLVYD